jgi:tetratricopeptide (TPR) repeat protein
MRLNRSVRELVTPEERIQSAESALRAVRKTHRPKSISILRGRLGVVVAQAEAGQVDAALVGLDEVKSDLRAKYGQDGFTTLRWVATTEYSVATALAELKRHDEAIPLFRHAITIFEKRNEDREPEALTCMSRLGESLTVIGRFDEAHEVLTRALAGFTEKLGIEAFPTVSTKRRLANLLSQQGDVDASLELYRETLEALTATLGTDHAETQYTTLSVAEALFKSGQFEEARTMAQSVIRLREVSGSSDNGIARLAKIMVDYAETATSNDPNMPLSDDEDGVAGSTPRL